MRAIWYQCTEWLWKIVLLTPVTSRGVTDLYPSSWSIEHARTIFCVKLSINNHIVGLAHKNHIINEILTSNERVWCTTQLALWRWVSTIKSVVLTADVFHLFTTYIRRPHRTVRFCLEQNHTALHCCRIIIYYFYKKNNPHRTAP